jgi:hypothetical protein
MARWAHLPSHEAGSIVDYHDFPFCYVFAGLSIYSGRLKGSDDQGRAALLHRSRDTISCTVDRSQRTNQRYSNLNETTFLVYSGLYLLIEVIAYPST